MIRIARQTVLTLAMISAIAGCGQRMAILPGERIDVSVDATPSVGAREVPFSAPVARANAEWTHTAGTPAHDLVNPALGAAATRLWSVRIGQGNSRGHRITAQPVVAGGRIFTLDSRAQVAAVSPGGALLWTADLTPPRDRPDNASGGGLAFGAGRLAVTLGFGELAALDPATGAVAWRQQLGAAATSAPTVAGGQIFVSGRDGTGWAVDAATGRVLWTVASTPDRLGVIGGAAPAVSGDTVVFPFLSGELVAANVQTGAVLWTAYLLGERAGRAYARVTDITGDPVIVGRRVYAANHSGETVAIDIGTGQALWSAPKGALGPVAVAGGSVFLLSDRNDLVRLNADTGERLWDVQLPLFVDERARRRKAVYAKYGPLLAGGRLIVASDDGAMRFFDPASGGLRATVPLPSGAAAAPAIAGETLYIVTEDGTLSAFR